MVQMIYKMMGSIDRKILIITFIPLMIWLIAIVLFYYYSDIFGIDIFPAWAFAMVTIPICVGSIGICYVIMITRGVVHENRRELRMLEEK